MHKCTSYGPDKSGRTRVHAQRTHVHRTEVVTTMSRSPQASSPKIFEFANRIHPDQAAHHEPPHQDLHCSPFVYKFHYGKHDA